MKDPTLDREEGGPDTLFQFSINWIGNDHGDPFNVNVVVSDVEYEMEKDMTTVSGDITYVLTTPLPEGEHEHHFEATYSGGIIRFPLGDEIEGPIVYYPFVQNSGFSLKDTVDGKATYEFFIDMESRSGTPDSVFLSIGGEEYKVTENEGAPYLSIRYTIEKDLGRGTYEISFVLNYDIPIIVELDLLTVTIEEDDEYEPPVQPSGGSGGSGLPIFLFVIIGLFVVGIIAFFVLMRRSNMKKMERYAEVDWDGEDEDH